MLRIDTDRVSTDGHGVTRRDFMRLGALGGLALPSLLRTRAMADEDAPKDTSVVWLWLEGGAPHLETFDPKMDLPSECRSVTGEVSTRLPGVSFGGGFPKLAAVADKMAIVRSFTHQNSGHRGGAHWVMTGFDNRIVDGSPGAAPTHPGLGSIVARVRGPNNPVTGVPTFVRHGLVNSDSPAFLGSAYGAFEIGSGAPDSLVLKIPRERLENRRRLLESLDTLSREIDSGGLLEGADRFQQQAYSTVLGKTAEAFDLKREDPKTIARYGKGLGQQLLLARRLSEAGCGFVTVSYGGWDMHGEIQKKLESRSPELDHAAAAFIQDTVERGLDRNILLVITGEFGRTPRINKDGGRDHWASLSTLALAGGGLKMGQVVGESAPGADVPASRPVRPQDLMATVFHVLGIPQDTQFSDSLGRPRRMIEDGSPIRELM
jgi:hypothetical protein